MAPTFSLPKWRQVWTSYASSLIKWLPRTTGRLPANRSLPRTWRRNTSPWPLGELASKAQVPAAEKSDNPAPQGEPSASADGTPSPRRRQPRPQSRAGKNSLRLTTAHRRRRIRRKRRLPKPTRCLSSAITHKSEGHVETVPRQRRRSPRRA